jgi:hypothetical protein
MSKSLILISLASIYVVFFIYSILIGGVFSSVFSLDIYFFHRLVLVLLIPLILLLLKKDFVPNIVDVVAPFVLIVIWLGVITFVGKSGVISFVIAPSVIGVLILTYYSYLFLPIRKDITVFFSMVWLAIICSSFLAIHYALPMFGD